MRRIMGGLVVAGLASAGCGIGVGSMSAAASPVLGSPVPAKLDFAARPFSCHERRDYMWGDQWEEHYWVTTVCDSSPAFKLSGLSRVARFVAMGGGVKRGWARVTTDGDEATSTSITEIDATAIGHAMVGRVGVALGVTMVVPLEGDSSFRGYGFRTSVAPIPQLSLDGAYTWVGGSYHRGPTNVIDVDGTRASVGGTVMLYARNWWRLSVALAYTTTDAGTYQSHGVTYQLVSTLW